MYLPRHSMIGVWEGMKLFAVKTFRPLPRSDTLHLVKFDIERGLGTSSISEENFEVLFSLLLSFASSSQQQKTILNNRWSIIQTNNWV